MIEAYAVECNNICKQFKKKKVLKNISFQMPMGKTLGLIGPNGSGKTTLLKILSTLIHADSGTAAICGFDVHRYPAEIKRKIGFVPSEERSFFWRLSGRRNLNFFAALHDLHGTEKKKAVDAALRSIKLYEKGNVQFNEYSTGMKQALGIARSFMHNPQVFIMDEPFRSLSPDISSGIRKIIHDKVKNENKAFIIASHNLSELEELADLFCMLINGTIVAFGTPDQIRRNAALPSSIDISGIFDHYMNGGIPL